MHRAESGNQTQASGGPPLAEFFRTCLGPLAGSCALYQGSSRGTPGHRFLSGAGSHRHPLPSMGQKCQTLRRKQVFSINLIICTG